MLHVKQFYYAMRCWR